MPCGRPATRCGSRLLVLWAAYRCLAALGRRQAGPAPGRDAPGTLGYVLKDEETTQVRAAIKAIAAGRDWISPRLAYILATDDAADRPALSPQETRALQLYATACR